MQLLNIDSAIYYFLKNLHQYKKLYQKNITFINQHRYAIVTTEDNNKLLFVFKREPFFSYSKVFNQKGVGEAINEKTIHFCLNGGIKDIYICYSSGNIYYTQIEQWLNGEKRMNQQDNVMQLCLSLINLKSIKSGDLSGTTRS